ncbi:MAG: beta-phosphoglucomutase family hydrolase, partial [Gammaproteobacteria bacterium]|nr:beta-phosphoglucomutase family hydrolase [Gammaproteobacteria bacterium]
MRLKGAIFDFDGVVVDTTPLHYAAWEKLLITAHKIPFDSTIYEEIVNGRKSSEVITELLPHLAPSQQQQALKLKQDYYHELIEQGKLKLFQSSIKLIKELAAKNIKIAVASSSRSVEYILKRSNIISLFNAIVSGQETKHGKPHPESFLNAASKLALNVNECVVFEDAKAGVEAAKNGGFLCVGV